MKYFYLFCCFLLMISCNTKNIKPKKPSFLIGNWVRTNNADSLITYETWQKDFSGIGLTLKGKDTTFMEQMLILEKNDSLYLVVSGVNETPTLFKFTQQTDTSFVCENPQNEFPKKIKYLFVDNKLQAEVSNEDFSIDFLFKKKN